MKKSIATVAAVALFAVGYLAGAYFQIPAFNKEQMEGSIGKAKAYNQIQDPEIEAAMEKLATDTAFQNQAITAAVILSSRIYEMDSLTQQTIEATKDVKELEKLNKSMQNLYIRTQNARKAYDEYMAETAKVIGGEKAEGYEQASNNALLAFTVLEAKLENFSKVIDCFADYLHDNKNDEVDKVAVKWVEFCAEDAVLNQDKGKIDSWKQTYSDVENHKVNLGKINKLSEFPTPKGLVLKLGQQVFAGTSVNVLNNLTNKQLDLLKGRTDAMQSVLNSYVHSVEQRSELAGAIPSLNQMKVLGSGSVLIHIDE